ncbi:MAG: response regulator [Gemmatimonadaceae bacterium]|nr:response regulator [Gemmatimonadaceae bacterium]
MRFLSRIFPAPTARSHETLIGRRVLIVDDNALVRTALQRQLEQWGMQAQATASADDALVWLERGDAFDIALVDLAMPVYSGPEVATAIRRHRSAPQLPLVLLASSGAESGATGDVARQYDPLFRARIQKPLRTRQLKNVLIDALSPVAARVPVSVTVAVAVAVASPETPAMTTRVLVADDNPVNRLLLQTMLRKLGYTAVSTAVNGAKTSCTPVPMASTGS